MKRVQGSRGSPSRVHDMSSTCVIVLHNRFMVGRSRASKGMLAPLSESISRRLRERGTHLGETQRRALPPLGSHTCRGLQIPSDVHRWPTWLEGCLPHRPRNRHFPQSMIISTPSSTMILLSLFPPFYVCCLTLPSFPLPPTPPAPPPQSPRSSPLALTRSSPLALTRSSLSNGAHLLLGSPLFPHELLPAYASINLVPPAIPPLSSSSLCLAHSHPPHCLPWTTSKYRGLHLSPPIGPSM